MPGSFVAGDTAVDPAVDLAVDLAVIIVAYNSAADIESLLTSLRVPALAHRMRVIVVDNDSTDDTLGVLAGHPDVTVISGAGNRGYAGGINLALRRLGPAPSILILNPDTVVWPHSIPAMLASQASTGAGIVVPLVVDSLGHPQPSLRREPTVSGCFGEALFGGHATRRPVWLTETVYDPAAYGRAHPVEWATGAALLIRRDLADRLGDWDEGYFLYSEETDYFRRARDAGATVWFTPDAIVTHRQGGSGMSAGQAALLSVNRVRYARRHGSRSEAAWVRLAVTLHAALRVGRGTHRHTLRILVDRRRWASLPHATVSAQVAAGERS